MIMSERCPHYMGLVGKELVILLFECVVGKYVVIFYAFSFPPGVYFGTLNLIASIPDPSILPLFPNWDNLPQSAKGRYQGVTWKITCADQISIVSHRLRCARCPILTPEGQLPM